MNTLSLTSKVLKFKGTMWQLSNITQVNKLVYTPEKPHGFKSFAGALVGILIGVASIDSGSVGFGLLLILLSGCCFAFFIYNNSIDRREWIAALESSAGSGYYLSSHLESEIDRVLHGINDAMESSDGFTFTQDFSGMTIIDKVEHSNIIPHSTIVASTVSA